MLTYFSLLIMDLDNDSLDLDRFRITSRREVITLLRQVMRRNQFVRMDSAQGQDSAVTAILNVDDEDDLIVIDAASTVAVNERILASDVVRFETVLDNIRIRFSAQDVTNCEFNNRPALCFSLPTDVIRLQRREHYRVHAPITKPIRCTIRVPDADPEVHSTTTVYGTLHNISGGGVSITDEKKLIPTEIGLIYDSCLIDIPGSPITVTLQLMNVHEITLTNGKQVHRLGFMFVNPSNAIDTTVQRYISKLEREQNSRN